MQKKFHHRPVPQNVRQKWPDKVTNQRARSRHHHSERPECNYHLFVATMKFQSLLLGSATLTVVLIGVGLLLFVMFVPFIAFWYLPPMTHQSWTTAFAASWRSSAASLPFVDSHGISFRISKTNLSNSKARHVYSVSDCQNRSDS